MNTSSVTSTHCVTPPTSSSSASLSYTVAGLTSAAEATRAAVERRSPRSIRPRCSTVASSASPTSSILEDGPDGARYRLRDTKLARSVKVEALLQLSAYADTLARGGVPVADEVELVLGDGAVATYRVDELLPVYLPRRAALERLLDEHLARGSAVSWDDQHVRACFRCPECSVEVRARDDLLLVAGMRVTQRARMLDAGITSVHALAEHDGAVPELSARTVTALTAQARLQVAERVDGKPPYEVVDAQPLMVLPDANKGDVFFDFEGDPLWTVNGREWGLEYLWGVLTVTDEFTPYWAHDRASERQALVDFLAMVRKRLKKYPGMHVYHYAAYEKSTLLRLAGRYGVGENDVDDLLRNGILVDLYPLVRKSIRVGAENYSIKSLEPLYMGNELRDGEVTTATDSITQYARFCALRDEGNADDAADRAQGDRGLQPLRLPVDATAARLADGKSHRVRGPAARPTTRPRRRGADTGGGQRRPRAQADEVRGRRCRGAHRRADRRRDGGRRQGLSPAGGQTVLVGALRPRQQPRRRVVRQRRRLRRGTPRDRRRLAPAAAGPQAATPRTALR